MQEHECSIVCFYDDDRLCICVCIDNDDTEDMRNALIRQRIGTHTTTTVTVVVLAFVVTIVSVIVIVPIVALTQCRGVFVHCFGEGLDIFLERVLYTGVGADTSWADGRGAEGGHHLTTSGVGH